jgi:hypothetical protein
MIQQQTKTGLLSMLAFVLLACLLAFSGMATYVWWNWQRGNHFCSTPLSWVVLLLLVAIVCLSFIAGTLSMLIKKKNAGPSI